MHASDCPALDPFAHLLGDAGKCTCGAEPPAAPSSDMLLARRMADHCHEVDDANGVATYAYILPHCLNWLETHDYDVLLTFRAEAPGREDAIPRDDLRRWNAHSIWDLPKVPPHAPGYGYPLVMVLWDHAAFDYRGAAVAAVA